MERTISRDEARRYYDRAGRMQDRQAFYEDGALAALVKNADFASAGAVFELGCGTGRFAALLLERHLRSEARYVGIDLSGTMIAIARERLKPFSGRAEVHQTDGSFDFAGFGGPFDRAVATYVFDLMSEDDIRAALAGIHSALGKGGLLCAAGLTRGIGVASNAASSLWTWVFRINPRLVGGCRPIQLVEMLAPETWRIVHREVVVNAAIPSEVVIAERL